MSEDSKSQRKQQKRAEKPTLEALNIPTLSHSTRASFPLFSQFPFSSSLVILFTAIMRVSTPSLKSSHHTRHIVQRLKSASDLEKLLSEDFDQELISMRQAMKTTEAKLGRYQDSKEFLGLAKASLAETYSHVNPSLERNMMRVNLASRGKLGELPDVSIRSFKSPQPMKSSLKPEEQVHIDQFYEHPASSKAINKLPLPDSPHFNSALFGRKALPSTSNFLKSSHSNEHAEANKRAIFSIMPKEEGQLKEIDAESINHPTTALTFFWTIKPLAGSRPESREGASMLLVDRKVYLFGGQSMTKRNDIRVMHPDSGTWIMLSTYYSPKGRIGHSLCPYKNMLFLFGGWSHYSQRLRMRRCFKKVYVLTISEENRWQRYSCSGDSPKSRRDHAMAYLGSSMLIYGGIDGHSRVLKSARVLDMETLRWQKLGVRGQNKPGRRSAATLTAVFPTAWTLRWDLSVFALPRAGPDTSYNYIGFYLFGGLHQTALNDLWLLRVTETTFYWQELHPAGLAPSPRFAHTTTHIGQMLVICGGRNDLAVNTANGAFSDVVILRLEMLRWEHVNLAGSCPEGRWGHCAVGFGSKILIFGGLNYAAFLPATMYVLETEQLQAMELIKIEEAKEEKIRQRKKFIRSEG